MMVGGPPGMPIPPHMLDQDMIGAIKIKDGLFIGDELASTVSNLFQRSLSILEMTRVLRKTAVEVFINLSCYRPFTSIM